MIKTRFSSYKKASVKSMSADNYLFIDRENNCVYVRFASAVYGGLSEEAVRGEKPAYQGSDYKDAACWASKFEPVEYGVYTGTLCPGCETEVEDNEETYPYCSWCTVFEAARTQLGEKANIVDIFQEELRPHLSEDRG